MNPEPWSVLSEVPKMSSTCRQLIIEDDRWKTTKSRVKKKIPKIKTQAPKVTRARPCHAYTAGTSHPASALRGSYGAFYRWGLLKTRLPCLRARLDVLRQRTDPQARKHTLHASEVHSPVEWQHQRFPPVETFHTPHHQSHRAASRSYHEVLQQPTLKTTFRTKYLVFLSVILHLSAKSDKKSRPAPIEMSYNSHIDALYESPR